MSEGTETRAACANQLTRRDLLLGALGGATAATMLAACNDGSAGDDDVVGGSDAGAETPDAAGGGGDGGGQCTVYPVETEGPFYLDLDMLRRDITEGLDGAPLRIVVKVVGGAGCAALRDVAVDIWHCDAAGVYSGFPGQLGGLDTTGETFLRGTQITDDAGVAQFDSIFPGWYPGRTTHIHFKVHLGATSEATSQMYFEEAINSAVYLTAPYSAHGQKDTSNQADSVTQGDVPPLAVVTGDAAGYTATLTVTVAG